MNLGRWSAALLVLSLAIGAQAAHIGEKPAVASHVDQTKIDSGELTFDSLFESGRILFSARFNTLDGQGRPASRGDGMPRAPGSAPRFIRTSGPDANSCAGCHNEPFAGGAGDVVANVFVLAQTLDPVTSSVSGDFSNERNTLGMNGSGALEMLAREMSSELLAIRAAAITDARARGTAVVRPLLAKGVSFGTLRATPEGVVDTSGVAGVNADLIIRPFHQKGVVRSLREFSNNAFNHHHGMQAVERFGSGDPDGDGVRDELTIGDITAVTVWQAALNMPGQVIPGDADAALAVRSGEQTFSRLGCASCHVPALLLSSSTFSEPSPFNVAGNLRPEDVARPFTFDLAADGPLPRPQRTRDGRLVVRAFTDFKRHDLCDAEIQHYCDEKIVQAGVSTRQFLTRRLWDAGSTAPYGHRGDLTTLTEAIEAHGGEGRAARDAFVAASEADRAGVIEFLQSLQILPDGSAPVVEEDHLARDKEIQP